MKRMYVQMMNLSSLEKHLTEVFIVSTRCKHNFDFRRLLLTHAVYSVTLFTRIQLHFQIHSIISKSTQIHNYFTAFEFINANFK